MDICGIDELPFRGDEEEIVEDSIHGFDVYCEILNETHKSAFHLNDLH